MSDVDELDDQKVQAAAEGKEPQRSEVLSAMRLRAKALVITKLMPNPSLMGMCEDVVSQVTVALIEGLPRLKNRTVTGLNAFMCSVVRNKVNDLLESWIEHSKLSLYSCMPDGSSSMLLLDVLSAGGTSPSSAAARNEMISKLSSCMGKLSSRQREVFWMRIFVRLSHSEIGEQLGLTEDAARRLFARAWDALKKCMRNGRDTGTGHGLSG